MHERNMVDTRWMGIDGEGVGRAPHRYVMLCAADSSGPVDYIEDVNGLNTETCLKWLLSLARRRQNARIAGYYLSYDWTMILRDLPNRSIYKLLRPELRAGDSGEFAPVRWRGYSLHYLSGMMRISRGSQCVTVWDLGRYYQCSFVTALEASGLGCPELIVRMKAERGRGTWDDSALDRMREYCLVECQHLARLAEQLETQHTSIGLSPRAWHGPGSTAAAVMRAHGTDRYIAPLPADAELAARRAYFGGRFEHAVLGTKDGCFSYDIRSAYPAAIHTLPCLAHARWTHTRRAPAETDIALIRFRVSDIGDRVWGPLPCRLADGRIVWPRGSFSGWVWSVEFWPAVRYWRGVDYAREAWILQRNCDCEPFSFIPELYTWRITRPENKTVVKLALNSLYGKIAQKIPTQYSSRALAGIITATCRARMLELIARHSDESRLYAIATDGAYSSEQHDIMGPGLGDWDRTYEGVMTFLRPGIYWSDAKIRARGVGRQHLQSQLAAALSAIESGRPVAQLGMSTHFGNARQCVYRTITGEIRRSSAYGEWVDVPVQLSLTPGPKRSDQWTPPVVDHVESAPYDPFKTSPESRALRLIGSLLEGRIR